MDLRIIKTQKIIREAFIELLSQQDYESITIKDVLNKAMINRATFYKYYTGKGDLAGKMIDEFKVEVEKLLTDCLNTQTRCLRDIMDNHAKNIFQLRKQMLALWKIRTKHHNLYQDMFEMSKQNYIELAKLQNLLTPEILDYQATMVATLFMASCQYYFEKDQPIPSDLPDTWQHMIDTIKI